MLYLPQNIYDRRLSCQGGNIMNKSFTVIDKNRNIQIKADTIIKFSFENKDYIVYSIEESEQNRQIFVSRLILNSEGKYFIENILPEEKSKLNTIVYNVVILTPTEAKKGTEASSLISGLIEKFSVNLSSEIPDLLEQEYFNNCSIAITNKLLVEDAIKFYSENLINNDGGNQLKVPTWTIPTENTMVMEAPAGVSPTEGEVVNKIEESSVQNVPITPVVPTQQATQSVTQVLPNQNIPNLVNNQNIAPTEVVPNNSAVQEQSINSVPVSNGGFNTPLASESGATVENLPNPQLDKLGGNVAIVSDPSLKSAGVAVQPNIGKMKKAGFAINKYIIIGTICLLLAVAVVIVAYILIQKKTTGV